MARLTITFGEVKNFLFVRDGRRAAWIAAGCGVLLGLFMRLWVYSRAFYISRDGILYLEEAKALLRDPACINGFARPPLFQWLWSRLIWTGLPEVGSGVFLALSCGVGALVLIYPLCREFKLGRWASVLTVWLAAVNPELVKHSIRPQREAVYLFTMTAAMLLLLMSLRRKNFYWAQIVAAVCCVMCVLSRIEGVQLGLFWLTVAVIGWINDSRPAWRRFADALVFSCACVSSLLVMGLVMGYDRLRIFKVMWNLTAER